jgi:metal-sulfur cluster biosynthetic enzyme
MTVDILVRFPQELADALKIERQATGCPTAEFIRRAVVRALKRLPKKKEQSNGNT